MILRRLLAERRQAAPFELAGCHFSDLKLRGTSRIGLPSWQARLGREEVKIYRCFGADQARLIEWLSARPELQGILPECMLRRGAILVVRWLPGQSFDKNKAFRQDLELVCRVAGQQARLHGVQLAADLLPLSSSYLGYLWERFEKYQGILNLEGIGEELLVAASSLANGSELRVSHPDVVPQNLVTLPDSESLVIIDNELLSVNAYPLIDLFNTHRYFDAKKQAGYVRPYLEAYARAGGDLHPLLDHEPGYLALWGLRQLGSLLQNGNLAEVQRLGRQWAEEGSRSHPLIETTKRILGE